MLLRSLVSGISGFIIGIVFFMMPPMATADDVLPRTDLSDENPEPEPVETPKTQVEEFISDELIFEFETRESQQWWEGARASSFETSVGYPLSGRQTVAVVGQKEIMDPYDAKNQSHTREAEDVVGFKYEIAL